jgi:hypothetical protein
MNLYGVLKERLWDNDYYIVVNALRDSMFYLAQDIGNEPWFLRDKAKNNMAELLVKCSVFG